MDAVFVKDGKPNIYKYVLTCTKGRVQTQAANNAYLKEVVWGTVENVTFCFIYFYCPGCLV